MLDLWNTKRGQAAAPAWSSLHALELVSEMPNMAIFDIFHQPFDMVCRLMGTRFVNAIGYDATGNSVRTYSGTELLILRASWLLENTQPMLVTGLPLVWSPKKQSKHYNSLCLPYVGKDGQIDTISYLNEFRSD